MPELSSLQAGRFRPTETRAGHACDTVSRCAREPIGRVVAIGGAGARLTLDPGRLVACARDEDAAVSLAGQVGGRVKIATPKGWVVAAIRDLQNAPGEEGGAAVVAEVDLSGEALEDRATGHLHAFRRGVTHYPLTGAAVHAMTLGDLRQVHAGDGRQSIEIGNVHPTDEIRASLYVDSLLGRHFALLGSTGSGKSTATALVLHRICDAAPEGRIVMIDPHGEYATAFRDRSEVLDSTTLKMPYWLLNFEEHCEVLLRSSGSERHVDRDILAKCLLAARRKSRMAEGLDRVTVDSPVPYLLSDVTTMLTEEMGRLEKATSSAPYLRIRSRIEELKADPRYRFMFSGLQMGDIMGDFIARVFRLPANGRPITIIDVSALPSDITGTVVAVLARLAFDFAVWARADSPRPLLLVLEEAHRYLPRQDSDQRPSVAGILSRIAKEGRKYGVGLCLVTQRPSDLAEGVLSQCGTIIAMRLNNERDQAIVRAAMPEGSGSFLDVIPALRNRECVLCGEGVAVPLRASFDTLEFARRPASDDPSFMRQWKETGDEAGLVARAVRRWRGQGN